MSNDKGFRSMSALVDALRKAEEGLRGGTLPLAALDEAASDARELYERLIVLRHKAREAAQAKARPAAPPPPAQAQPAAAREEKPAAEPVAPPPVREAQPAAPGPEAPIRLNTQPAAPRQTTLEEVIAQEEAPVMKTAAEYLKEAQAAKTAMRSNESVAEKLERARITDLAKAISLSDKFWFTKELFGGDAKAYEVGVALLNSAKDLGEAKSFLQQELIAKLKSPPDPEALEAFSELIERRFA